jgi:FAD/FMN-containing dehydrogenase
MTGLAGGAVPVVPSVLMSLERMRSIREFDRHAGTITVEAGVVMETVQQAADAEGFFYPLDVGGRGSCQTGGNLATNAGGHWVLRYGMARQSVLGLEVVLADGTVLPGLRKMLKDNAGYNWKDLFIGSEGTLGIITAAVLRLQPKSFSRVTALCAVADYDAVLSLLSIARRGFADQLTAFEVMWPEFYDLATRGLDRTPPLPAEYGAYVLIETRGQDPDRDGAHFERVLEAAYEQQVVLDAVIAHSGEQIEALWSIRDTPGRWREAGHHPQLSFDIGASPGDLGRLVVDLREKFNALMANVNVIYFAHAADGNLHVSVPMNGSLTEKSVESTVYEAIGRIGGTISAEHGIGFLKRDYLGISRSAAEVTLMKSIKGLLDPTGILNPEKVL